MSKTDGIAVVNMNDGVNSKNEAERLRRFYENSEEMFFVLDRRGRFVDLSPKFAEILEYDVNELLGKTSRSVVHPVDRTRLRDFFKKVLEKKDYGVERGVFRFVTKSGKIRWMKITEWPVFRNGRVVEVEGILRDITDLKSVEEELKSIKEKYRFYMEVSEEGVVVHDGERIQDANKKFAEMFGYEVKELIGMPVLNLVAPESRDKILRNIKKGFEGSYEVVGVKRDGTKFDVELIVKNSVYMGRVVRVAVARDITEKKRMIEELRRLEERYRDLWENANDIFYLHDLEGWFLDANRKALETFGYSKDDIGKVNIKDILVGDYAEIAYRKISEIIQTGKPTEAFELLCRSRDGRLIWVEVRPRPVFEDGKIVAIQGVARDITEKKRMIEELNKKERKYRALFENSPDAVVLVTLMGEFLDVNKAFEDLIGYTKEEIVGRSYREVFDERSAKILQEKFNEVYEKNIDLVKVEFDIKTRKGKNVSVEGNIRLLRDNGNAIGFLGSFRDISEIKKLLNKVESSERMYRFLVENSQDIIYIIDVDGHFKFVNEAVVRLVKYSKDEIIGEHYSRFVHPEWVDRVREFYKRQVLEKIPVTYYEIPILDKDGRVVWIGQNVQIVTENGNVTELHAIARDITERKMLEERLRNLNEQLRVMNKILRHDIMNDLTVIGGILQVLEPKNDVEREMIKTALNRIDKAAKFIKKMKEMETALAEGDEKLRNVDVGDVVRKVVKAYPALNCRIFGEGKVKADDALYSVIDNIIGNVISHSGSDKVDIVIEKKNGWVEIRICDYGKGIPDEIKEKIFKEGFKYGNTGGTGIGLYIVKKLVERYGGSIWVEDTKPQGATFVIRLKAA